MSAAIEGCGTPEFARVEIKLNDKGGLRNAASKLRDLSDQLDKIASGSLTDDIATYVAWAAIRSTSQKLRTGE